jgi:hypothetical protein
MGVQSIYKHELSSELSIVAIQLFLSYTPVVPPVADTFVADELSRSNRLIYCRVLSVFPLALNSKTII